MPPVTPLLLHGPVTAEPLILKSLSSYIKPMTLDLQNVSQCSLKDQFQKWNSGILAPVNQLPFSQHSTICHLTSRIDGPRHKTTCTETANQYKFSFQTRLLLVATMLLN